MGIHLFLFELNPGWLRSSATPKSQTKTITFNILKLPLKRTAELRKNHAIMKKEKIHPAPLRERKELIKKRVLKKIKKIKKKKNKGKIKELKALKEFKSPESRTAHKIEEESAPESLKTPDLEQYQSAFYPSQEQAQDIVSHARVSHLTGGSGSGFSGVSVIPPRYRINPSPHYPDIARRRGYEGTVIIDALVTRNGRVSDTRIIKSSGYSVLDRSAIKAIKRWIFVPGTQNGKSIEMWVRIPVRFQLKK